MTISCNTIKATYLYLSSSFLLTVASAAVVFLHLKVSFVLIFISMCDAAICSHAAVPLYLSVCVLNDTSEASPAGAHLCAYLPMGDDASGSVCSLSVTLALNGRRTGLNRSGPIHAEPKNGSGHGDLDLTPSSQVALGPSWYKYSPITKATFLNEARQIESGGEGMTGGRQREVKERWKMTAMPKWVAQISWGRQKREGNFDLEWQKWGDCCCHHSDGQAKR